MWEAIVDNSIKDILLSFLKFEYGKPIEESELGIIVYKFKFKAQIVAEFNYVMRDELGWTCTIKIYDLSLSRILSEKFFIEIKSVK
jgi:hypothetical protein